jgi:3-keto-5-aminohexanoate cleavage enzyme
MEKLIITTAVIGSAPRREQNPNLPYTPKEIAEEALRSWRAGAAVVHVHVRHPQKGTPAFERELFAEVVERIRAESDMIVNLSTSGFNILKPEEDQKRFMPMELEPDICSLDIGSLNFRGGVFVNTTQWVDEAAKRMRSQGIKPEMEVFDTGHLRQALDMVQRGLVDPPPYFQICLGIAWGAPGDIQSLLAFKERLPEDSQWSVLAPGSMQLPITTHAMLLGGHVRVGFEDNIYLSKGVKAESNAQFVERTVEIARVLQREVATCEEARSILSLPAKGK